MHRGMDIFDRVKWDEAFARKVKTLRLHWAYEEGEMLDVMTSKHLGICQATPRLYPLFFSFLF